MIGWHLVTPALFLMWAAWIGIWIAAAPWSKPTAWQESRLSRWLHLGPLVLVAVLLGVRRVLPRVLRQHVLPPGAVLPVVGLGLVAAGLALAVWARIRIGRNWSATVTVKEEHTLVTGGPYRFVRHPIYSGLLLGFLGTALVIGEWRGFLAFALGLAAFARKLRVEEARMAEIFPEYEAYRQRTAALVPFFW